MKRVAVILSGCGVFDGAEIHESVLTLLHLDKANVHYQCFAPDMPQQHVINHVTGEVVEGETRHVLVEAARIARGEIKSLSELREDDFDALIFPGGFGAAKNLCSFAVDGQTMQIQPDVLAVCQRFAKATKPIGLICIAPVMAAKIFGESVKCTIGHDQATADAINAMGAQHVSCKVNDIVIDEQHKLVTTPAYMLAQRIGEASAGIEKLVSAVLERC
ncbi:isoprenoid biosynthesis glyoxalase ElbB [Zooshikella marina]|uniref:isoprenoid biosynthesis glyoxalase ElbB n=1 Tax=Zooshikella ganghwensis TaxID=202772 RepID=UPI001BAEEF94|nr:isoprenoid biosynthesis glyoxalase ElbB [Zooshikella ganghwensis]MBU2706506.1 isoprenoid biosynthesis glyoxalase ElbB [Zooshikella ganghwensis]